MVAPGSRKISITQLTHKAMAFPPRQGGSNKPSGVAIRCVFGLFSVMDSTHQGIFAFDLAIFAFGPDVLSNTAQYFKILRKPPL